MSNIMPVIFHTIVSLVLFLIPKLPLNNYEL